MTGFFEMVAWSWNYCLLLINDQCIVFQHHILIFLKIHLIAIIKYIICCLSWFWNVILKITLITLGMLLMGWENLELQDHLHFITLPFYHFTSPYHIIKVIFQVGGYEDDEDDMGDLKIKNIQEELAQVIAYNEQQLNDFYTSLMFSQFHLLSCCCCTSSLLKEILLLFLFLKIKLVSGKLRCGCVWLVVDAWCSASLYLVSALTRQHINFYEC